MFTFTSFKGFYWNKYVFVFGGYASGNTYKADIDRFDGSTMSANFNSLSQACSDSAAENLNSDIYLFGGYFTTYNGSSYVPQYTSVIRKFDGYISTTTGINSSSSSNQAAATIGSNVYLFGGYYVTGLIGGGQPDVNKYSLNTIRRFSGSSIATESATMSNSQWASAASTLGQNAYIFGGSYLTSQGTSNPTIYNLNSIQKFDGTARTTESATLADSTSGLKSVSLNSKIYVFGATAVHSYDGVTRSSTGISYTSQSASASTLSTNAYLFGGYTGGNYVNTTKKFDLTAITTTAFNLSFAKMNSVACGF